MGVRRERDTDQRGTGSRLTCLGKEPHAGGFLHVERFFVPEQKPCEAWLAGECLGELMENRLRNKTMVGFCCLMAAAAVGLRARPALKGKVPLEM